MNNNVHLESNQSRDNVNNNVSHDNDNVNFLGDNLGLGVSSSLGM